jgi:sugar transferase (PEP-CTERM system associated)
LSIRIFGHYVSLPLLLLMLAEAVVHVAVVYLAAGVRFMHFELEIASPTGESISLLPRALLYAGVVLGVMTAFGLYGSALSRHERREYKVRFLASFPAAALAMAMIFYAVPTSFLGRGIMALSLLFSAALSLLVRELFFGMVGYDALKPRVLVLGTGSRAAEIEALLARLGPGAGFHLVGFLRCGGTHVQVNPAKVLEGGPSSLRELVAEHRVHEIVVGVRDRRHGNLSMSELLACKLDGVSVVDLSTFFERETGLVQLNSVTPSWMVFSEGFYKSAARKILKRTFDICVSGGILLVASPAMLLAALAILLETGRPALYRQPRIGEHGRIFEILKFRSMRTDAEKDGVARWAQQNDARVTRVGKLLRRTRIDELPQLFNVLRGEMSVVGPRPERPPFVHELCQKVPYYASRHSVKPGITGWAQIRYPYGASVEDAARKLQFDLYYVKNHSLFLDLVIVFQTTPVVLFAEGSR